MELYVELYQPELYEAYMLGKDINCHPEDKSHVFAAQPPAMGIEP